MIRICACWEILICRCALRRRLASLLWRLYMSGWTSSSSACWRHAQTSYLWYYSTAPTYKWCVVLSFSHNMHGKLAPACVMVLASWCLVGRYISAEPAWTHYARDRTFIIGNGSDVMHRVLPDRDLLHYYSDLSRLYAWDFIIAWVMFTCSDPKKICNACMHACVHNGNSV